MWETKVSNAQNAENSRPITGSNSFETHPFDYDDFVYKFNQGESWCSVGNGGYTHAGAKLTFWQNYQSSILPLLQRRLDEGWEPISEVGAGGISLRQYTTLRWSAGGWIWFFIVTIATMGLGLLMLFFGLSPYVEPVEFRVKLRRRRR
jgi:hypothetical protein